MTIKEIIRVIEKNAPRTYAEEWDNVGLLIGDETETAHGALIALELTEAVLQEAIEGGFNLIITHHPLIFSGIKKINYHDPIGRIIRRVITNNIAVYAAHTNLDNAPNGVNQMLAKKIGLRETTILSPQQPLSDLAEMTGSGVIGTLSEPLNEKDFLLRLKNILSVPVLRHSDFVGKPIHKVALCGGSGSYLIHSALEQNADVFITADVKYHDFFTPDKKILLVDAGHYETEQFTTSLLLDILNQNFSNFAARISSLSTNAVNYLI
ncbi:MAG: Nif3-like dinuclear metal center hexameric protein [Bacteroidales bacterium]|nr:Nif3-like dinuclear metal center hexameric protein [Bacteroidales bacterium]